MFSIGIRVTVPKEGLSSEVKTRLASFVHDVYPDVHLGSLDIETDSLVKFQVCSCRALPLNSSLNM